MLQKFDIISKYADSDIKLPVRKTTDSAGYDFFVAEDIVIPSYESNIIKMAEYGMENHLDLREAPLTLDEIGAMTKATKAKPTLVPTGVKWYGEPGTYLQLSVRSSCPLKNWLILGNGVGIIDRDYVDNPDNEGHIFFQIINLSPFDIQLKAGDCIGQGVILPYITTDNDAANGARVGGFGSTDQV